MAARFPSLLTGSTKRGIGFWARASVATAGAAAIAGGAFLAGGTGHPTATRPPSQSPSTAPHAKLASAPPNNMYWMDAADGGIFTEPIGVTPFYGSEGYHHLNQPVVGMAAAPNGRGYWLVARDGGVFTEGTIGFWGSAAGRTTSPIVGMAVTPDGGGYWIVGSDGHVYNFGDAPDFGSEYPKHLNQPVVGMAATPDGGGYWLVASDGGVFTHGDAPYLGGEGWHPLNQPVVGMAASPDGKGYWLAAADGGVFTEGQVRFYGSEGYHHLNQPVVGIAASPLGHGYWLVASDGGIFTEGPDAGFGGSEGYHHLNQPVVGMAAVPVLFANSIGLSSSPSTLVANGVSTSTITATATDSSGNRIPGRTVNFSVTTPGCGSLSVAQGVTDLSGTVSTVYTASRTAASCSVRAADAYAPVANTTVITQGAGAPTTVTASHASDGNQTADAGHIGLPVAFTVRDAQGNGVPGASLDLSVPPTLGNATLGGAGFPTTVATDSSGVFTGKLMDVVAGDTGKLTATLHGTGVSDATGTITITAGAFAKLGKPGVSTVTAGQQYTVPIVATDAYNNPVNPDTAGFTFGGSALADPTQNGPTPTPSFAAPFAGGAATLDVTSLVAGSTRQLSITDGSVSTTTDPYTVSPASVNGLTASGAQSTNADTASTTGVPVNFTAIDKYGNAEVAGILIDFTANSPSGHAAVSPGSANTDATGTASTTLTDATAETDTVTGTVHGKTITVNSGNITISPGAFATMTLAAPASAPTVGQQYTMTLTGTDHEGNPTGPSSGTVQFTGSALGTAPDQNPNHKGSASAGTFSNGVATVTATSYASGPAEDLTANLGSINSNKVTYAIKAGSYQQLQVSSTSLVASDLGQTLFFQDPTAPAPTATVTLTALDPYGNTITGNADKVQVTLQPDAKVTGESSDGGSVTGTAAASGPDTAGPVTTLVTLAGGSGTFTYTAPTSVVPTSGNGFISIADQISTPAAGQPANIYATVTKVHSVTVNLAQTTFTADYGNTTGDAVTSYAADGMGNFLGTVPIDFTTVGLPGSPTFSPASPVLTTAPLTPPNGPASTTMHATKVGSGVVVASLRGAPLSSPILHSDSPQVTVNVGNFALLSLSAPSPASPTAGINYNSTVTATDAEHNPTVPSGTLGKSGTALAPAPNNAQLPGTVSVAPFNATTGQATLTGTAYFAQTGATLQLTYGSISSNTLTFNVGNNVPNAVTASVPSSCCNADTGNNGFVLTVTAVDQYGNAIPSQALSLTTDTLANASVDTTDPIGSAQQKNATSLTAQQAPQVTTDSTGTAKATVYDTKAGDTGQIIATIASPSVVGHTSTITITPGALATLTVTTPTSPQIAGTQYTVTVTALDAEKNAVNPSTGTTCTNTTAPVSCSGSALAVAPDKTTTGTVAPAAFSGGQSTFTVTSYDAASNVVLTVADGGVSGSTNQFNVVAGHAVQYGMTSTNTDYKANTATITPTSDNELVPFTITVLDQWQNVAADHQSDTIQVTLTPGAVADGGKLVAGQTTSSDSNGTQQVQVTLLGGIGHFSYQAASTRVLGSTGTIQFADVTFALTPLPTSIAIQN